MYNLKNIENIATPALVFYKDIIKENIAMAIRTVAGDPARIRSHVKSHKTVEIPQMQLAQGMTKFKTATIAETEMLAMEGFTDLMLAYTIVGANIDRFITLVQKYPKTKFSTIADNADVVEAISAAATKAGVTINLLVDVDAGLHRTGIAFEKAAELFRKIYTTPSLHAMGFHMYDGHIHDSDLGVRRAKSREAYDKIIAIRAELEAEGKTVETMVLGGTPTFPCYAEYSAGERGTELSPGTCFLQDHGYQSNYADMPFVPAALLLMRVISKTGDNLTFDLGYKAVASDPAPDQRLRLVGQDFTFVMQNEEHLVLNLPNTQAKVGDIFYAIPTHICPTAALYEEILVADGYGNIVDKWKVRARKRAINI
jgi:D-serine deaminase-like pyridoxal phosphate-dependent protein